MEIESVDKGADRVRESERAGKRGGAKVAQPAQAEEVAPCGLCGDPLIEGAGGSREPRGAFHVGCIREARRETLGRRDHTDVEYPRASRRRRGS